MPQPSVTPSSAPTLKEQAPVGFAAVSVYNNHRRASAGWWLHCATTRSVTMCTAEMVVMEIEQTHVPSTSLTSAHHWPWLPLTLSHYEIFIVLKEKQNCLWRFFVLSVSILLSLTSGQCFKTSQTCHPALSGPKRYLEVFRYAKNNSTHN